MNRPVIDTSHAQTSKTTAQHTKPTDAPWWQLYSVLIIMIGTGIVIAVNDPALLNNPIVLLACIFVFFGFVMVWSRRHAREIEAEDWQGPMGGRDSITDWPESSSTSPEQNTPRR